MNSRIKRNVIVIWSWKRFAATLLALIVVAAAAAGFGVYRHMKAKEDASPHGIVSMSYSVRGI